ncbi:class I SAM-dependent methyltransferase [Nocardioides sp. CFH 31398]|uniref:class I SAM-dependent methyltransferase n=1 Tax=Nocardioides sp. CFH 31398 TaxID=2919579 RepID=UPI001F06B8DB|nr:methyltransferase domain-containing protein [Nocardioides sp. CFH 31398]MCH1867690.1 class I SAM-dependent methyltransferase [Nocardioides sp. CFH 31398]
MSDDDLLAAWRAAWGGESRGWDFSDLAGRVGTASPPWSYDDLAREALRASRTAVDLGTGGGEWLLGVRDAWPAELHATEGWAPNVPVATAALAPYGVTVRTYDGEAGDPLPYGDASLDLVLARHEAYGEDEVLRVLRPGGRLLTQQVDGHEMDDLAGWFGGGAPYPEVTLAALRGRARAAGLVVDRGEDWSGPIRFADVTAMLGYLSRMPWQLPKGFTVDAHADTLLALHRAGPVVATVRRFLLDARRP